MHAHSTYISCLCAAVCLLMCVYVHTCTCACAQAGHNQLQMILSVCQLPRIAALVCSPPTGLGKYFSNSMFTFTLLHSHSLWAFLIPCTSLSEIICFFIIYPQWPGATPPQCLNWANSTARCPHVNAGAKLSCSNLDAFIAVAASSCIFCILYLWFFLHMKTQRQFQQQGIPLCDRWVRLMRVLLRHDLACWQASEIWKPTARWGVIIIHTCTLKVVLLKLCQGINSSPWKR